MELVQQYMERWKPASPPPVPVRSAYRMFSNQGYESGTITSNNVEFPFEYTELHYTRRQEEAPLYGYSRGPEPSGFNRSIRSMELSMKIPMRQELFEVLERRMTVEIVTEQFAANAVSHSIRYLGERMAEVCFECTDFRILFQS